jgi:hypothetical protein
MVQPFKDEDGPALYLKMQFVVCSKQLRIVYRGKLVNAVQGNSHYLSLDPHETRKCTL